jgi:hypothetical protein
MLDLGWNPELTTRATRLGYRNGCLRRTGLRAISPQEPGHAHTMDREEMRGYKITGRHCVATTRDGTYMVIAAKMLNPYPL